MSKAQLETFYQEVLQDKALQERFKPLTERENVVALVMQIGRERNYNFSIEEVEAKVDEWNTYDSEQELNNELLESIAGGITVNGICFSWSFN
ncbi:Nif11-like leader peptide family natural product precursor [Nostoc sp. C117]|uniref:Nif11-like leader peptide family natural product precursor n=1 Tax=Nostoc sp. C117 TaxID=3349875 RepID=UPI00370D3B10